jgi:XTP/dITP diphosphohydrolase
MNVVMTARRRHRRSAGHGRRRAVLARRAGCAAGTRGSRHRPTSSRRRSRRWHCHETGPREQCRQAQRVRRSCWRRSTFEVLPQAHFNVPEADEPHVTFVENALAKARHAARPPACRRWPMIPACASARWAARRACRSARYAGEPKSDRATTPAGCRTARQGRPARALRRVLVLMRHADDPQPLITEGEWHGEIVDAPRGAAASATTRYFLVPELKFHRR